ncbi:MAG: class I SAM-dependent methyltransferase [Alphaproteobacteria bacterium]|nr:class I SAM-dependent methyltransferase [Alphaproteobacteria bacterium]
MLTRAHLDALRRWEIERVLALVPAPRGRVLEIGAAGGFQAALLAAQFERVDAVDLPQSIPAGDAAFPVKPYDGHRLPFPDGSFDMVFSSNVLEHIPHVEAFQAEIRRVLKPDGRAVHVLPSASWRLWTTLTHYLDLPVRIVLRLGRPRSSSFETRPAGAPQDGAKEMRHPEERANASVSKGDSAGRSRIFNALFEFRHGERGTTLGELYLFSRLAWRRLFRRNGFVCEAAVPLGLFYTGYSLFDRRVGIAARRCLARVLGSATVLYVLRAGA